MATRMKVDYAQVEPGSLNSIHEMSEYVENSGIEMGLRDLVYIRASQINGCAFCLDMHTQDAIARGIPPQKVGAVQVWRDAPFFSPKEKVVLEFTEAMTAISGGGLPEELYEKVRSEFNEHHYVALVMAINVINCWNRLMIACGGKAGMYSNKDLREGSPGYYAKDKY